jgi:hypothetical protein
MRRWLPILLLCLACLPASGEERVYAIMSLVGDGLLIVHQDISTGSRLDRNAREFVAINTPALDNAMVIAVEDGLRARDRSVKTVLLAARDPGLFTLQSRGLEEARGLALLLPVLRPIAQSAGATHLVLAAKYRDETRVLMAEGHVGAGRIEGVGFYLDDNMRVENRDTGAASQGYIAPFAYFSVSLVELSSGALLAQQVVREAHGISSQAAAIPWNALTAEQKIRMLQDLMRREAARAAQELLPR